MSKKPRPIIIDGNIAYVTLTKGYTAVIDAEDVYLVDKWNWCAHVEGVNSNGQHRNVYAVRGVRCENGKTKIVRLHCELMKSNYQVDHIDGNGLNCKKENLREATPNQNMMNSRKRIDNSSGHKGVSWSKSAGKWEAYIRNGGKKLYLGIFEDINEASKAYVIASQKYHKEYGRVE